MKTTPASDILWHLLRRNISVAQTVGYSLANLLGLAIVLCAVKFYLDIHNPADKSADTDPYIAADYLVVSPSVSGLGSLLGADNSFSRRQIADIEAQPWALRTGAFTAADFNVSASLSAGSRGLSTALFLESIPDDFFTTLPPGWDFTEGENVPILLNKDYLALYNYGFAASAGMPQLSEEMISMVPIRLTLSGNDQSTVLPARIVGFSSKLNTIAVPQRFMDWANARFGQSGDRNPSRLIIDTDPSMTPQIEEYLADHSLEAAGTSIASGRAAYFLSVGSAITGAIGALICLLALGILTLSIWLLLSKNRGKIHNLMLLGYTPGHIARRYTLLVAAVNAVITAAAVAAMLAVSSMWRQPLEAIGVTPVPAWSTIAVGIALMAAVTLVNALAIRRTVRSAFRG